jgi:hypothetical protein
MLCEEGEHAQVCVPGFVYGQEPPNVSSAHLGGMWGSRCTRLFITLTRDEEGSVQATSASTALGRLEVLCLRLGCGSLASLVLCVPPAHTQTYIEVARP